MDQNTDVVGIAQVATLDSSFNVREKLAAVTGMTGSVRGLEFYEEAMRTIAKVSLNLNKLCGAQAEARKKMGWQH